MCARCYVATLFVTNNVAASQVSKRGKKKRTGGEPPPSVRSEQNSDAPRIIRLMRSSTQLRREILCAEFSRHEFSSGSASIFENNDSHEPLQPLRGQLLDRKSVV